MRQRLTNVTSLTVWCRVVIDCGALVATVSIYTQPYEVVLYLLWLTLSLCWPAMRADFDGWRGLVEATFARRSSRSSHASSVCAICSAISPSSPSPAFSPSSAATTTASFTPFVVTLPFQLSFASSPYLQWQSQLPLLSRSLSPAVPEPLFLLPHAS